MRKIHMVILKIYTFRLKKIRGQIWQWQWLQVSEWSQNLKKRPKLLVLPKEAVIRISVKQPRKLEKKLQIKLQKKLHLQLLMVSEFEVLFLMRGSKSKILDLNLA